jgi:hypothetical protein
LVVQAGLSVLLWVSVGLGGSSLAVGVLFLKLGAGIGVVVLQSLYGGLAAGTGSTYGSSVVLASWSSYALAVGLSSL